MTSVADGVPTPPGATRRAVSRFKPGIGRAAGAEVVTLAIAAVTWLELWHFHESLKIGAPGPQIAFVIEMLLGAATLAVPAFGARALSRSIRARRLAAEQRLLDARTLREDATSDLLYLESSPMWQALLEDLARQTPLARIAARFHHGLARAIREMVGRIRDTSVAGASLNTIALSGGCFQNKLLLEELVRLLEADGLSCLLHSKVPTNDGGLALGQAAIAAARHLDRSNQADLRFN